MQHSHRYRSKRKVSDPPLSIELKRKNSNKKNRKNVFSENGNFKQVFSSSAFSSSPPPYAPTATAILDPLSSILYEADQE